KKPVLFRSSRLPERPSCYDGKQAGFLELRRLPRSPNRGAQVRGIRVLGLIAPGAVLLGHANDALLDLAPDPRSAWAATGFRAIELAGDKLAVPAQDGVWPRHLATSARTLRPRRWPISPSVARSVSESLGRPFSLAVRMRFSAARYSLSASSSWSTVPVT